MRIRAFSFLCPSRLSRSYAFPVEGENPNSTSVRIISVGLGRNSISLPRKGRNFKSYVVADNVGFGFVFTSPKAREFNKYK